MAKKGLEAKLITVFNPENGEEFEVFVTYEFLNENMLDEEEELYNYNYGFDIKNYVSSNNDDIPDWLTEEMIYSSLSEAIDESNYEQMFNTEDDNYDDDYDDTIKDDDFSDLDDDEDDW
jgi:hypothetical protein